MDHVCSYIASAEASNEDMKMEEIGDFPIEKLDEEYKNSNKWSESHSLLIQFTIDYRIVLVILFFAFFSRREFDAALYRWHTFRME